MLQKEDAQLSVDIEMYESTESTTNMYDTPLEVYKICFPNERHPKAMLKEIYRTLYASYIEGIATMSVSEIEDAMMTCRHPKSKGEIELEVKMVIEGQFNFLLETETEMSWNVINGASNDDRLDMKGKLEFLQGEKAKCETLMYVKAAPDRISDYSLYKNKLVVGRKWMVE